MNPEQRSLPEPRKTRKLPNTGLSSTTTIWIITALHLLTLTIALSAIHQRNVARDKYETMQVCTRARAMIDGASDNHCGYVQDKNSMEFLCTSYQPDATCSAEKY